MKELKIYIVPLSVLISLVFFLASCVKEGPAGKDGTDGEAGIDGEDGTASCIQCHDDTQLIASKAIQWESSLHATGGQFSNNSKECAPCHTSQGFLERMATGEESTNGPIQNANPPNCYTCHWIHKDYELSDWELTYFDAVTLWHTSNSTTAVDLGAGNLCANCHQAMHPEPMPEPDSDSIFIETSNWGLHYGPIANIIGATGGYEIGDGYASSDHATEIENSCIVCHMSLPVGSKAGGHQMGITYINQGISTMNYAGCFNCHDNVDELDLLFETTKNEMLNLLTQMETLLLDQQIMDSYYYAIPGMKHPDQAGALLNFNMVRTDNSYGVHNYLYSKKLLENSIESLK